MKTESEMTLHMKRDQGFTLIELVVVVAIVAILAAIAIPSYQRSVIRTHRAEAMSALQGLAQAMERYYVQQQPNPTYVGADNAGVPTIFPATSPIDGGAARYNLTVVATANTYLLTATPIGAQVGDGRIDLDNTGLRRWDKNNDGSMTGANESNWNEH